LFSLCIGFVFYRKSNGNSWNFVNKTNSVLNLDPKFTGKVVNKQNCSSLFGAVSNHRRRLTEPPSNARGFQLSSFQGFRIFRMLASVDLNALYAVLLIIIALFGFAFYSKSFEKLKVLASIFSIFSIT
jgi:hypothetical protein